jgi:glycosyltransferase involved in cell wall biosynthesis
MKVAVITSWLNRIPHNVADTTGIFVKEQVKALQNLGIEAAILYPDLMPHRDLPFFSPKRRLDTEGGIPTFRIQQFHLPKWSPVFLKSYIKKSVTLYDDYFSMYGKPDVIHAHNYWAGFVALAIKEKYGIPYVFTEHDIVFSEGKFRPWLTPLLKKMLREAAAVTVVGRGLQVALTPYCTKEILIVPNIINTQVFAPKIVESFEIEPPSVKPCQFVSVGTLGLYKGYDLLISAFADFLKDTSPVNACLTIIGGGGERKNLENQAIQLGVNQYITFKGVLPTTGIVQAFNQSNVFVSSSRFETFGVAMAEAMAMGLPILATPTDGAKAILTTETGILTADISVVAITEGLKKMYLERQKFDAQKIRQHVLVNFDGVIVAQQYLRIYDNVLS